MCTDGVPDLTGPAHEGLLAVAGAVVGLLAGRTLSGSVDDAALRASVAALHRLETRTHAEKLRRIGEIDRRGAYLGQARNTADLIADQLGLTRGEATATADTAAALARLPRTAAQLADGRIGPGHAREAARGLAQLDQVARHGVDLPANATSQLDEVIAGSGGGTRATVRQEIEQWSSQTTPEALGQRERRAFARRHAWIGATGDGIVTLEAKLDPVAAAHVKAAMAALARACGADDQRTAGQRHADALAELARRNLDQGDLPSAATQRPHVLLNTTPDALHDRPDPTPHAIRPTLEGVGLVSNDTARQVCCDADVTLIAVQS